MVMRVTGCQCCGKVRGEVVIVEVRGKDPYSFCSVDCVARWGAAIVAVREAA